MKKLIYLSVIGFALLFVACEPKTEYIKKSYINKNAVVDSIKDPIRNIGWLKETQAKFDADESETFKYRALIYLERMYSEGDVLPLIFKYEEYFSEAHKDFLSCRDTLVLESKYYGYQYYAKEKRAGWAINFLPHFLDEDYCPPFSSCCSYYSNLSENTAKHFRRIIDEALNNNEQHYNQIHNKVSAPIDDILVLYIDELIFRSKNITVLSCSRMDEVIK